MQVMDIFRSRLLCKVE